MQRKATRLKAMMIAFLSITLAIALCAGFYYFKIQQNEKYQNQLHFRELNNITVSLENGISAFKEFIFQQNKAIVSEVKNNFLTALEEKKGSLNQTQNFLLEQQKEILKQKQESDRKMKSSANDDYFSLDSEYLQAIDSLQVDTLTFLDEHVNEIKVLASVTSNLNSTNSALIRKLDNQYYNVGDCLFNQFDNYDLNEMYSDCFDAVYIDVITEVKEKINQTSKKKTSSNSINSNVYNQNSPLRSISKVTSPKAGLAKLRTGDQKTETWAIEISDWLGGSNDLYPLVLLVDGAGKLVAQKQSSDLNSSLVGITFNDVSSFLNEDSANKTENKGLGSTKLHSTTRGVSKYIDIMISGNEYRLFISPFSNQDLFNMTRSKSAVYCQYNDCDEVFYLIGLREKEKFNSTKQSISRSLVAAVILFTLSLIAFIPLLKIRLSSVSQAFSAWDRHTLAIGCVLLITVLSIGMFDYIYYNKVKSEQSKLGNSLFMQMRNAFNLELTSLIGIAYQNLNFITKEVDANSEYYDETFEAIIIEIENEMKAKKAQELRELNESEYTGFTEEELAINVAREVEEQLATLSEIEFKNIVKAKIKQYKLKTFKDYLLNNKAHSSYFLENLFVLNAGDSVEESVKMNGLAMWGTKSRFRGLNKDISLLKREYAVRGVQNRLWPVAIDQNEGYCESGLFIERVFNLRDGAKSTQFSLSCQQKEGSTLYDSLSFGTQIQTFTNTLMPANFGFVVFDNNTGKAIYHSEDDSRSLVENVFVETDNSGLLKAYMNTPYLYNQPTSFDVDYNGKVHNFTLGTLKKGVPWTLVVFYDKEKARAINLMSVLVTLTICFVVFILVYYFMIMIVPKSNRRGVFWPTPSESSNQKNITIFTILGGAILFFGGLSLIIANHVFDHHQTRYKQINNAQLGSNIAVAKSNIESYRNKVLDAESVSTNALQGVPCFLGTAEPKFDKVEGLQTCISLPTTLELDTEVLSSISYFNLLIEAFWNFSVLDGDIDETLIITSKVNQTISSKPFKEDYIDNSLNKHAFERASNPEPLDKQGSPFGMHHIVYGLLIAIAFAAFALVLFKITKEWIFERFFGFNIPPFFRLNEKTRYDVDQAIKDGFFSKHQYMTIIRPKQTTLHNLQSTHAQLNGPFKDLLLEAPLINGTVIQFQSLISEGESAEFAIDKLLAISKESHPEAQRLTIAISGLENTGFDEQTRKYALNLMEYVLEKTYINVILLCEVAPLFRLTQSELYPSKHEENRPSCASEMVRWSNVLKPFIKVYDWSPNCKQRLRHDADAATTLVQEAIAWPELREVLKQFIVFNKSAHPDNLQAYNDLLLDIESQEVEVNEVEVNEVKVNEDESSASALPAKIYINEALLDSTDINQAWLPDQIIEFFSANSSALYRYKWEQCTKTERIILFQIASGLEPNPLNRTPLEHLVRRGYICRDKGWFIVNTSFKEFVLQAEPADTIESWLLVANESIWQYLRIPFFAIVITLVAIMAYTATDAIETAIGVLSAVFGLIPLAIRNFSAIKTGST